MIVSLIIKHLNVSISACPEPEPLSEDFEADIEFAVNTKEDFNELSKSSELFYSHETFIIKFASTYFMSGRRSSLTVLIGPLGFNVFVGTVTTLLVIITLLSIFTKLIEPSITFDSVTSVVLRPLLDQCEERRLPSIKAYFRLILSTWLFYCLLVTDTYRSELISHMMKGQKKYWLREFKDITNPDCHITNFGNRPGQYPNSKDIIKSEMMNSVTLERRDKFSAILDNVNRTTEHLTQIHKLRGEKEYYDYLIKSIQTGAMLMIGDVFILKGFSDAAELLVGSRFYELSEEYIPNKIFWSVRQSPVQQSVISLLKRLRDSGTLQFFAAQDDSIHKAVINIQFKTTFSKGLKPESGVVSVRKRGTVETLKLRHVRTVCGILILGLIFSFAVLIVENIFKCFRKTRVQPIIETVPFNISKSITENFERSFRIIFGLSSPSDTPHAF